MVGEITGGRGKEGVEGCCGALARPDVHTFFAPFAAADEIGGVEVFLGSMGFSCLN